MSLLRKALDDGNGDARYIDTVPKRGYRFKADIRTVAADISGTERNLSSPEHFVETTETRAVDPPPSQTAKTSIVWSWRYAVLGLGVLGLAALSLMAILQRTPDGPGPLTSPARFDVTLPEPIQLPLFGSPVISPDGTRVAFVNRHNRQLWIRRLDSATAQAVSGTEGAISPFWSPDSRSIGFFADGKLKRVDVVGGPVLTLCDAPREPQRGAWGPDGAILFSIGRVYRVPDTGGVPRPVTDLDVSQGETHHTVMGFLSDGRRFIFGDRTHRGTFFVSLMDSARDRRVPVNRWVG